MRKPQDGQPTRRLGLVSAAGVLLALLAVALRLFYLPLHLAHDLYHGPDDHPLGHVSEQHDHPHDHSEQHLADHAGDLIAKRAAPQAPTVDVAATAPLDDGVRLLRSASWSGELPGTHPPDRRKAAANRPRGPPVLA